MVRSVLGNIHSVGSWRAAMPLAVSTRATKEACGPQGSPATSWARLAIQAAARPGAVARWRTSIEEM
ncbi:hypothetical protein GCM10018790_76430 [Kitasatospora xanthocidica]|nr:hypothetical protein GCM10018790_76430 [Kitasatospora xanthocidica]